MYKEEVVIFSPGVFQEFGHAFDYTSGLTNAYLLKDFKVVVFGFDGPQLELFKTKYPTVVIEIVKRKVGLINQKSIYDKLKRVVLRSRDQVKLQSKLKSYLNQNHKPSYILFETFDYWSLSRFIPNFKPDVKVIFHETNFNFRQSSLLAGLFKTLIRGRVKIILEYSSKIFVHGEFMRENMINSFGNSYASKIYSIPYGADYDDNLTMSSRDSYLLEKGLDSDYKYLLLFGTLRKDKIYAPIFKFLNSNSKWRCIIAGPEGDMSNEELNDLIHKYCDFSKVVRFDYFIKNEAQESFFGLCDVVLSFYEPYIRHESGTAKLARSYCKPLIVYGPSDLINYVNDNDIGWSIESDSEIDIELGLLLERYLSLSKKQLAHLENRINDAARRFSWHNVVRLLN